VDKKLRENNEQTPDGWMDGWLLSAVEGTVRRMANRVVLRAILSIFTSQPQDLAKEWTTVQDNDGLYCADLFSGRDNYAIMTTLWMTCNRVSRATAAAAATLLCLIVNRLQCNAALSRCPI